MISEAERPLKRWVVQYGDKFDEEGHRVDPNRPWEVYPTFTWTCYAFSAEHAEGKFWDSCGDGDDGWVILSVDRPRSQDGRVVTDFDRKAA